MDFILPIVNTVLIYLSWIPILKAIKSLVRRSLDSRRRTRVPINRNEETQVHFFDRLNRYRNFLFSRSKKWLFLYLLLAVVIFAVSYLVEAWWIGVFVSIISVIFIWTLMSSKAAEPLADRDKTLQRMLDLKRSKMGLINNKSNFLNHEEEFVILSWYDSIKPGQENIPKHKRKTMPMPEKVRLFLPVTYDELNSPHFLDAWSLAFGDGGRWVADKTDKTNPGWNSTTGIATIIRQKPLPQLAKWHESYVLNPRVAWSFFPLAIGSENGIILEDAFNPGNQIHVLGYDVAGDQPSVSGKFGTPVGPEIVAAPMALIAGDTGGGKSLSLDTEVITIGPDGSRNVKKMQEVTIDDLLMDANGEPTSINQLYPVHTPNSMYEIETEDGRKIKCGDDHRWFIQLEEVSKHKTGFVDWLKTTSALSNIQSDTSPQEKEEILSKVKGKDKLYLSLLLDSIGWSSETFDGARYWTTQDVCSAFYHLREALADDRDILLGKIVDMEELIDLHDRELDIEIPEVVR